MNKKLFMLWSFLLCFALGISAEEVTIDFTKKGYTNGQEVATVEQDGITVKFDKGSNSNTPKYYNTGTAVRVYGGGNMIVSSANTITSIALTFGSGDGSNAITTDVGTYSNKTWTGSSTAVKFTVGGASGHKRIKSMVVTYGAAPTIDKPSITGTTPFYGETTVSIDCTTEGAAIYYTTDGTEPTTTSTAYTAPFILNASATVKAISAKGEDVSAVVSKDFVALTGYATIASVTELANNAQFAFTGDAIVVASPTNYYTYIKDATGYSLIYSANKKFEVGSHITPNWTGKVSIYNNLFEMVPTSTLTTVEGETETITYPEANVAELTAENMNKVVTLKGVTYTQPASGKKEFNIVSGETTIAGYNQFGLTIAAPEAEKTYDIVGAISVYKTNVQFQPISITEAEPAPVAPVWKDIKIDFTNDKVMTSDETNVVSFGIKMNDDATATRVAADDPTANIVITGKYHSTQHGLSNFSATVKVEGPVKIGMGSCAWGGNVTVKDENGVEVANAFNTNNGACWATADGAEKNVIYTYYKGEAATLTIAGGSYTPYFSVEKIALEDIPTVMKVNYSLGETGAAGILPANFEIDGGKTFTIPVNRTLYVEGKTLTGWTDGTKTYAIGEEITAVADTEITLVPVFTDNTVTLADRKEAVTIVWDFQQKNGAPVVAVQGKTMIWVAQAVVNGQTIDVKMDIDATSGKVANGNWQDWCQINPNTKLTIPAAKDAVISMESYSATTTTTIAGEVINQETTKPIYTYTGEEATVDIVIGDGSYWRTVAVAIPAAVVEDGPVVTTYDFEDGNILFTCDSRISAEVVSGEQTIKGTNENTITLDSKAVRFKCANNAQNGYSFAHYDFSSLVEKAKTVKVDFEYWNTDGGRAIVSLGDASVRGTTGNSSKNTYSNKGAIFALGSNKDNALLNGAKSSKGTYCDKWLNVSVTVDVLNATYSYSIKEKATGTEIKAESDIAYYSKEALACSQIDLFGFINNSTPALLDNIVITVEKDNRVYADYKVTYVDESGAEIKDATVRNGAANEAAEVVNSDKESFKNADGTKKYIYKSDDSEGKTIAEDGSTVITVTFREAVKYNYSVEAVNEAGELMSSLGEYSDFEGENAKAPYNTYVLNESDSTLYEAAKTGKEYNKYVALTEDNMKVQVTYTKSSISNVVYYQEAENVWGLTKATNGNTGIRSSNSASAYAAEEDVELTSLSTGKYKMTAVICDAKTDKSGSFSFTAKADTILTVNTVDVNWTSGTSEEFTVIGNTPISLVKGGNDMQAVDFFYIQKTGVVPPTEVANIAALKDVQEGMEVKLALTDAVVNLWSGSGQSMASYVEDATGAIKFDMGLSNIEWMRDSIAMNGYVYASYGKDYDGIPQLSVSDSTIASKVDTVAAVPTSKVMTVADASTESAISRYVKFEKVEFAKKVIDDWGTTECYLVQGTDTITFFDKFSLFGWGAMPDFKSFDEVQGFISVYEGKFEFYPYGEYKANYTPAVVVENIAAAKAVENGTNVNLTLKDAKITAYLPSKWGGSATAFIEDASGAIQISGDVLSSFGVESNNMILNGNMYVKYVNEWGTIQLSAGDSLAYSKVEAKEGVVEATTMAVKDIKAETNVARYIEIASPSFKYDEENYCYVAIQEGDTIIVVDNFGWMSQNFEKDDEYNLILPDSVTSIKGIVMWDDWNGYSISPLSIEEFVAPQDIVVNVTEGEIAEAVETAKAAVKKVGKITINLTEGVSYTIANSIVAPAALVINGNGATIDASALGANFIQSAVTEEAKTVDSIAVLNVTVKGLGKALYYSAGKNIGISNFVVDNSVIEMAKDVVVFDFTKGSAAMNFAVKNSTIYAPTATTKSIYSSQGGEKGDAYGATVDTPQTFSFENTTLYNIAYNKNFFTHRSNGQKWMKFVVKNNVIVNCGKANFMTSVNGGQDSPNPIYDADAANSVGTLVDGAYTDLSASQTVQGNAMGTSVVTNPGFKDVAAGDFTVYAGSEQAKQKIGDPRWLVEFDETLTGIDGINAAATLNGAVYTINGIKVREAGETLKGLSKGMYIINGKKYVVK